MPPHICPWWLAYTFDNPLRAFIHHPEKILSPWIRENMVVADIGCGMGHFSLGLARLVGDGGKVYAVDIQPRMLERVVKRAARSGLSERIETHRCHPDGVDLDIQLDFAIAFYMVHETPDSLRFFQQMYARIKPSGLLFFTEPKFHVSYNYFEKELSDACAVGFQISQQPHIAFSHAALLKVPR